MERPSCLLGKRLHPNWLSVRANLRESLQNTIDYRSDVGRRVEQFGVEMLGADPIYELWGATHDGLAGLAEADATLYSPERKGSP